MPLEQNDLDDYICLETAHWPKLGVGPNWHKNEELSVVLPQAGEIRWIRITSEHATPKAGRFWALYKPVESVNDQCFPEMTGEDILNLNEWAVVRCELIDLGATTWARDERLRCLPQDSFDAEEWLTELGDTPEVREFVEVALPGLRESHSEEAIRADPNYHGWVQVRVIQCVPLFDIPAVFGQSSSTPPLQMTVNGPLITIPGHRMDYIEGGTQVSEEFIVSKTTPQRLLIDRGPTMDVWHIVNEPLAEIVVMGGSN